MNNEKQHSEYKIIETVATPTFDGISVETHPEDAYEKIEPPRPINVKICIDPSSDDKLYAYGNILNGTLNLIALTESPANAAQVRENGNVSGAATNKTLEQIMQMVETYTVTQVKLEGTINYDSTVQSWQDYELVN